MSRGRPDLDEARAALAALVERTVRRRFSTSTGAFVEVLLERAATRMPAAPAIEYARRLCLDDLYLATSCTRGDEEAWRECRDRYFEFIHDFARRFLPHASAADVADGIIADLWRRERFALYDGRSTLRTWLGTVVANAAVNAGKVERRRVPFDPQGAEWRRAAMARDRGREEQEAERVLADLVRRALAALDAEPKLLLLLYYEQGLTLDEMQALLGASKATLSRRLDRIRQRVRDGVDDLARRELHLDARTLGERLDLTRLELDLAAVLDVKDGGDGAV